MGRLVPIILNQKKPCLWLIDRVKIALASTRIDKSIALFAVDKNYQKIDKLTDLTVFIFGLVYIVLSNIHDLSGWGKMIYFYFTFYIYGKLILKNIDNKVMRTPITLFASMLYFLLFLMVIKENRKSTLQLYTQIVLLFISIVICVYWLNNKFQNIFTYLNKKETL